jgi:hypothetical protein
MTMKTKALTVAILGAVLAAASALFTDPASAIHLSAPWALLVGAGIASAYSVERALQKLAAGASPKSLFLSTETWGQILVALAAIASDAAGVVKPGHAAALIAVAAFMTRITKLLAKIPPGLLGWKLGAVPQVSPEKTPITVPIRPRDAGYVASPRLMLAIGLAAGLLCLGLSIRKACADGLVLDLSPNWQCSPVGSLSGYQYNVKTGSFQRGVALGAGYGCRYTGWKIPLSIEGVGSFAVNDNAPNAAQGSLIFVADDNFGFGPGTQIFKDPVTGNLTGQMLLSLYLTGSWAATVEQFKQAKVQAAQASTPEGTP